MNQLVSRTAAGAEERLWSVRVMSRLKRCLCDSAAEYKEFATYKSCRKCKHSCAKRKVPCRQKFSWYYHQNDWTDEFLARLGAKPRLRMLTKYCMLLDKMEAREVVKQAIAEYGYLPTRKEIHDDKQIEYDMEREWAYLETWDCR